jgi:hypothetical protein
LDRLSNGPPIFVTSVRDPEYSQHPKTGPSGIQMVIFQTKIWSGFQMAAILFKPNNGSHLVFSIRKPDKKVPFSNGEN